MVTEKDVVAAVGALRAWRGRKSPTGDYLPLDRVVDSVAPRRVAHVVEEGLRAVVTAPGLWRYTADPEGPIGSAMKWLNSQGLEIARRRRSDE
jgi:hypothetical protein